MAERPGGLVDLDVLLWLGWSGGRLGMLLIAVGKPCRAFMVRGTQLLPHTRYSDSEARAPLSLGAHAEQRQALAVAAGGAREVPLAPGRLRVEVQCRLPPATHLRV